MRSTWGTGRRGVARVHEQATPEAKRCVVSVPGNRWRGSVTAPAIRGCERLFTVAPTLQEQHRADGEIGPLQGPAWEAVSRMSPAQGTPETTQAGACAPTWEDVVGDTGFEPVTSTVSR